MSTSLFFNECEEEDKRGIEDLNSVIIEKRGNDILQVKLFKIIKKHVNETPQAL